MKNRRVAPALILSASQNMGATGPSSAAAEGPVREPSHKPKEDCLRLVLRPLITVRHAGVIQVTLGNHCRPHAESPTRLSGSGLRLEQRLT